MLFHDANFLSVPKGKSNRNKSIPGWSEHVNAARKTALFGMNCGLITAHLGMVLWLI